MSYRLFSVLTKEQKILRCSSRLSFCLSALITTVTKTVIKGDISKMHYFLFKKVIACISLSYSKICQIHFKAITSEICALNFPL